MPVHGLFCNFVVKYIYKLNIITMKITVFCSANENIDPDFFRMTEELGRWIGERHHSLVFGGTNQGLMHCIAKAVKEHGGSVIGVVPSMVEKGGRTSPYLDVEIPTDNLSDRKDLMISKGDIILALPGGIGTLDEVFSIAASHCIGYTSKKVVLYNMKGFWSSAIALLDDLAAKGMVRGDWHDIIAVADNIEDIKRIAAEQ